MDNDKITEKYKEHLTNDLPGKIPQSTLLSVKQAIRKKKKDQNSKNFLRLFSKVAILILAIGGITFMILKKSTHPEKTSNSEKTISTAQPFSLEFENIKPLNASSDNYPLIRNNMMLFLKEKNEQIFLEVFNQKDKNTVWKSHNLRQVSSLVASDHQVYVRSGTPGKNESIKAFSIQTGKELWSHPLNSDMVKAGASNLTLTSGLLCWTEQKHIIIIDATTGEQKTNQEILDVKRLSIPRMIGDKLYIASDKAIFTVDLLTNYQLKEHIRFEKKGSRFKTPYISVNAQNILVAHQQIKKTSVFCYDIQTGIKKWNRQLNGPLHHIYLKDNIYLRSNQLYAIDWKNGNIQWSRKIDGCSPLSFSEGTLYTTKGKDEKDAGVLLALEMKSGKTIWKKSLAISCTGLVINGSEGYVCGNNGILYGIKL